MGRRASKSVTKASLPEKNQVLPGQRLDMIGSAAERKNVLLP